MTVEASRATVPVFVIIPPTGGSLGGAEKRFAELYRYLRRLADKPPDGAKPVIFPRLVVEDKLRDSLVRARVIPEELARETVTALPSDFHPLRLGRLAKRIAKEEPRAVFHSVMNGIFTHPTIARRTLMSVTAVRVDDKNFSRGGRAYLFAGAAASRGVDILNAQVKRTLDSWLPFKGSAFTLTPNTCVDLELYAAAPFSERKNRLVFLGEFLVRKQVFRLLDRLRAIDVELRARNVADLEYLFLGRDHGERSASRECEELAAKYGMDVRAYFSDNPQEELSRAKVFFSVQYLENYPSKSLAEALACGAMPIITDVGQSRAMADVEFGHFVPRDFEVADIASAAGDILSLSENDYERKRAIARTFVEKNFSIKTMASYYADLYRGIAARD